MALMDSGRRHSSISGVLFKTLVFVCRINQILGNAFNALFSLYVIFPAIRNVPVLNVSCKAVLAASATILVVVQ